MVTTAATYECPSLPVETKPILRTATACTLMTIVTLVSANSVSVRLPQSLSFEAPACISTTCISDPGYNGNISLSWDGISIMKEKMADSLLRLQEIAALQDNWNGNGATTFSKELIARARQLISSLSIQPIILPTGRDSIQMEYERQNGDYLEFELFEGGRLKMFSYTHDGVSETKDILFSSANKVVCDFYGRDL